MTIKKLGLLAFVLMLVIGLVVMNGCAKKEKPVEETSTVEETPSPVPVDEFAVATEITATDATSQAKDTEIKAVLTEVFGGAKLTAEDVAASTLTYVVQRAVVAEDSATLKASLEKAGYKGTEKNEAGVITIEVAKKKENLTISTNETKQNITVTYTK